jgi:hypothetical protein
VALQGAWEGDFSHRPLGGGGYVIVELLQLYIPPFMGAFYVCLQRRPAIAGHATYQCQYGFPDTQRAGRNRLADDLSRRSR